MKWNQLEEWCWTKRTGRKFEFVEAFRKMDKDLHTLRYFSVNLETAGEADIELTLKRAGTDLKTVRGAMGEGADAHIALLFFEDEGEDLRSLDQWQEFESPKEFAAFLEDEYGIAI